MINQFRKGKLKVCTSFCTLSWIIWVGFGAIIFTKICIQISILWLKFPLHFRANFSFFSRNAVEFFKVQRSELNCRLLSSDAIEIAISFFPRSFLPEKEGRGTHASLYLLNHEHYSRGVKILGRKRVVIKSNRKMRW